MRKRRKKGREGRKEEGRIGERGRRSEGGEGRRKGREEGRRRGECSLHCMLALYFLHHLQKHLADGIMNCSLDHSRPKFSLQ